MPDSFWIKFVGSICKDVNALTFTHAHCTTFIIVTFFRPIHRHILYASLQITYCSYIALNYVVTPVLCTWSDTYGHYEL